MYDIIWITLSRYISDKGYPFWETSIDDETDAGEKKFLAEW